MQGRKAKTGKVDVLRTVKDLRCYTKYKLTNQSAKVSHMAKHRRVLGQRQRTFTYCTGHSLYSTTSLSLASQIPEGNMLIGSAG